MTVNEKVIEALSFLGIPVIPDFSDDDSKEYITFDVIDDKGDTFADNEPIAVVAYLQIHYVAPIEKDYLNAKKKIRRALLDSDFSYPEVTDVTRNGDKVRHLVFECSVENEYDLETENQD